MHAPLIEPKEVTIETQSGSKKTYILSKFPAIQGREIISQYPVSAIPKIGDYATNQAVMLKLMCFVAVNIDGTELKLFTKELVDNHVPDWETLVKIEKGMMEYNCSFFGEGRNSNFSAVIAQKARPLITKILTDLLEQSSLKKAQHSTNSEQSTR